jgi:hypothetical protein
MPPGVQAPVPSHVPLFAAMNMSPVHEGAPHEVLLVG